MKIRQCFVSNSSSSSFMIAVKKYETLDLKDLLLKSFKISKESPLYSIALGIVDCVISNKYSISNIKALEKYFKEDRYLDEEELKDNDEYNEMLNLINKDFLILLGEVGDESDDPIEACLCGLDWNYEDENIVIKKEGGY